MKFKKPQINLMHLSQTGSIARVVVPYVLFAGLWIYLSDQILSALVNDAKLLTSLQTYKGLAFIAVTAILLSLLMRRELKRRKEILSNQETLRKRVLNIVEGISDGFAAVDRDWRFVYLNQRAAVLLHREKETLLGRHVWTEFADAVDQPLYHACQRAMHESKNEVLELYYPPWRRWFEIHISPTDSGISIFFQDISTRKRAILMLGNEKEALEQIARGEPLDNILDTIVRNTEAACQGAFCMIMLLDQAGEHLRVRAAPSLPPEYIQAIDGLKPGPAAASCGTAVYRRAPVYIDDIAREPLWDYHRELARQHGLRACWSTPILSGDGRILGTFAMYYRKSRLPRPEDIEMFEHITHLTGVAIVRRENQEDLNRQMEMLQALYETAQEIPRNFDATALAQIIVEKCVKQFGASLAWLGSAETDGSIAPVAYYPAGTDAMHELQLRWDNPLQELGPTGRAIQTGQPQLTENIVTGSAISAWRDAAPAAGIRCSAAFALIGKDRPIGALNIYSRDAGFFTAERMQFFTAYARLVATKIENARLYERLRDSANELRRLSQRLFRTQETERHHIARELHDEIGQLLTVVKINLQSLLRKLNDPDNLSLLDISIQSLDQLVGKVRNLSLDLRPSILDDLGLIPALRWFAQRQTKFLGLAINLDVTDTLPRLHSEIETACFRIVQEAVTNAARHAHASIVTVSIALDDNEVMLTVQDNGTGFDVHKTRRRKSENGSGFGLLGMTERAQLVGGKLEIRSGPEQGTIIQALFPLRKADTPTYETNQSSARG